ncbi:MAG: 4-hydroxythreonine-4-phosphate dehydrogenase PdxA [Rhodospirillales bacterium]|nr:4-hydroxythreonine-4-phosphate dehydrogenase PdxA [Rhodospirillales bacterium]
MGEPAGIGGEITLAAWHRRAQENLPPFLILDDPDRLRKLASTLELDVAVEEISAPEFANDVFPRALPVIPLKLPHVVSLGAPDPANADTVIIAIRMATEFALAGRAAGVVTNPIHKETLLRAGFEHPGHTEYLSTLTGGSAVMMLASPLLRVVPVTVHRALREVPDLLTVDLIASHGRTVAEALVIDFGINAPRLAVAALNPHAGEGGTFGNEDDEIIAPAVRALAGEGINATGPHPADSLFRAGARENYDAVLCMYHDQALIPLKALDFDRGVNVTLGLPIVRTSPDHGTALDLAGTGKANPTGLVSALTMAATIARNRATHRNQSE